VNIGSIFNSSLIDRAFLTNTEVHGMSESVSGVVDFAAGSEQQDGAPTHYFLSVAGYLGSISGVRYIRQGFDTLRSSNLTCDNSLWGSRIFQLRLTDFQDLQNNVCMILLHVHLLLGNRFLNKFPRRQILVKQSVVRSHNKRTNVYRSLLGNHQRANGVAR
jgi:hypothetical protein